MLHNFLCSVLFNITKAAGSCEEKSQNVLRTQLPKQGSTPCGSRSRGQNVIDENNKLALDLLGIGLFDVVTVTCVFASVVKIEKLLLVRLVAVIYPLEKRSFQLCAYLPCEYFRLVVTVQKPRCQLSVRIGDDDFFVNRVLYSVRQNRGNVFKKFIIASAFHGQKQMFAELLEFLFAVRQKFEVLREIRNECVIMRHYPRRVKTRRATTLVNRKFASGANICEHIRPNFATLLAKRRRVFNRNNFSAAYASGRKQSKRRLFHISNASVSEVYRSD